jgi:hypothetical protein
MLSQFLNIEWTVTDIMLGILIILGIILLYKSLGFALRFYENIRKSRKPVEKNTIAKINNDI